MINNKFTGFAMVLSVVIALLTSSTIFASDWADNHIVGNWETAVYVDGKRLLTRVALDTDKEIGIKLREFAEYLGYSVNWESENKSIELISEQDKIKIIVDDNKCQKNGTVINLTKPVYIHDNYSYIPQSFLLDVLGIDTILVEIAEESNRVDGVYLAANTMVDNGKLTVVFFDDSIVTANLLSADGKDRRIILGFALAVQKEEIEISMDYAEFVKSNESIIKDIIYTSLQNMKFETYEAIMSDSFRDDFSTNMAEEINNAIGMQIVKYFYITSLVIQSR